MESKYIIQTNSWKILKRITIGLIGYLLGNKNKYINFIYLNEEIK